MDDLIPEHLEHIALPVELLYRVFSFVTVSDDGGLRSQRPPDATLHAVCLVNHHFRLLVQRILFSHVHLSVMGIKPVADPFTRFLALIRESPHIASLVTSLDVWSPEYWISGCLDQIIASLPKIRTLNLNSRGSFRTSSLLFCTPLWAQTVPKPAADSLWTYMFPRLTTLRISSLSEIPLIAIISACPYLQRLWLGGDSCADTPGTDVDFSPLVLHPLQDLNIYGYHLNAIHGFVRALERAGCNQIRSLVLGRSVNSQCDRHDLRGALLRHVAHTLTTLDITGLSIHGWAQDANIGIQSCLAIFSMTHNHLDFFHLCNLPHLVTFKAGIYPRFIIPRENAAEASEGPVICTSSQFLLAAMIPIFDSVSSDDLRPLKRLQIEILSPFCVTRNSWQMEDTSPEDYLWSQFDHGVARYSALGEFFEVLFLLKRESRDDNVELEVVQRCLHKRMPISREKGILHFEEDIRS